MKAFTVHQPWAGLIMEGVKTVENRSWAPKIALGTQLAVHAGKDVGIPPWVEHEVFGIAKTGRWDNGAILGTVVYRGVVTDAEALPKEARKWFVGPKAWILSDAKKWARPFPCKGKLGLWDVPGEGVQFVGAG